MSHNLFNTLQTFDLGNGQTGKFYSLPALEAAGVGPISKLPISIRIVLESVLRNCDGLKVQEANIRELANWKATEARTAEIPFVVARIVLQDFTGVPLLVDLAAMRSAVEKLGKNPIATSWSWWNSACSCERDGGATSLIGWEKRGVESSDNRPIFSSNRPMATG